MKPKLSAPCLLALLRILFFLPAHTCLSARAEEPQPAQTDYMPVVITPTVTWENPSGPQLPKSAQIWQDRMTPLEINPGLSVQLNNAPQLSKTYVAIVSLQTAADPKRLQDAQASVQASRERLAQAIEKLNNKREASNAQRASSQEQVDKLAQQLAQNLTTLKTMQDAQNALQARVKQMMAGSLNLHYSITLPNTTTLTLPQDRNLLYTPADAAALVKRNLMLTPEDRAKVKTLPLHK